LLYILLAIGCDGLGSTGSLSHFIQSINQSIIYLYQTNGPYQKI